MEEYEKRCGMGNDKVFQMPGWPAECGEGEKKSSDEGFCQQINVNVSWAAFHVVSRIEEEVWKFFMTSYDGVIRFEEQQIRDQGPLY